MTFSLCYAFNENFVLTISHDEVVHGKKSLLDKMPGDIPTKFANLRTFLAFMFAHPGKKLNFMGSEYGQFKEWDYKEGLEFFMLKYELHNKLFEYNKFLNRVYKETPALYQIEKSWDGFNWVSPDEKDNNVFIFERNDSDGKILLAVFNFSGNDYFNYRVGAIKGKYKILLNTDKKKFGGAGLVKGLTFNTVKRGAHGRKDSIKITLPKFSALYFIKEE
jgi:1,4-alpha-glucan branching enzyme